MSAVMTGTANVTDDDRNLIRAAVEARKQAYAPYSRFRVGAAAIDIDGRVYIGANMENASYGLSMCAEVGALTAATAAGALGKLVAVAVVGGAEAHPSEKIITPCGRCRQLIAEAAILSKRDLRVLCGNYDGADITAHTSSKLLPHSFSPDDLEQKTTQPIALAGGRRY